MAATPDSSSLRKHVENDARAFLNKCQKQAPKESFYGLAFCIDSDVRSFYCQANSEERLEHPGDRFNINEWKFTDDLGAPNADTALTAIWDAATGDDTKIRKECLNAI